MRASDMSSVTARSRCAGLAGRAAEQVGVHLGVEDREALPVRSGDVGVGVLDLDDETLELEPAKVVAATALGVGGGVGSEQPGDEDCWPSRNASLGRPSSTCVDSSRTRRLAAQFDVLVATTLSACNGTEFIGGKDFSV